MLHTADYAAAVLRRVIGFYEVPDDVDGGVSARMQRQQVLYRPGHHSHFVLAHQALRTQVGSYDVMAGQLDRLLSVMSMSRVRLGIIPSTALSLVPSNQFIMFDESLVHVEAVSAEISITQPAEIALYLRAFAALAGSAVYGAEARQLLEKEIEALQ